MRGNYCGLDDLPAVMLIGGVGLQMWL